MVKRIIRVRFRRRREGITNYKKRLNLVKGGFNRIAVRKSSRRIIGQVIKYSSAGDMILFTADSNELKKLGWPSRCNRSTSYLTGLLLAKKAGSKAGECILDIGLSAPIPNSVSFIFAKGCVDGGMKLSGTFKQEESIYDFTATSKYAEELKKDQQRHTRQFGAYIKEGRQPEALPRLFKEVKEMIMRGE